MTRRRPTLALVTVFLAAAAGAACGGSSGASLAPSPAGSPVPAGPTPVPSPQITSGRPPAGAVSVVKRYWTLLGEGRYAAAHALTTGPHLPDAKSEPRTIDAVRYLRPARAVWRTAGADATVEFASWVYIVPTATGSPFGTQPARWYMFARVVRMSDGSWRLVELGTGP